MQKHRFISVVAAIFLGIAVAVCAADPGRPIPDGVQAHIAVSAPRQFIDNAIQYVGDATKKTGSYVPPELLNMLAAMYMPVPLDAWDADNALHIFFIRSDEGMLNMVAVFSRDSFDDLISGMEQRGWEFGDPEEDETFDMVVPTSLPDGRRMVVVDLGEGWSALANNVGDTAHIAAFIADNGGWELDEQPEGTILVRVRTAGSDVDFAANLTRAVASKADEIVKTIADAGLTEKAGRWVVDMAEKYGRVIGEELEQAEEVQIAAGFDDGRFVLGFAGLFGKKSWMRAWAGMMESADDFPEGDLLKRLPEGFMTCGVGAPAVKVIPDIEKISETFFSELSELAPDRNDALIRYSKALFGGNPGESATASYFNNGKPYQVTIVNLPGVQSAIDLIPEVGEAASAIMEQSFANPKESLRLPGEKQTDGEREWYCLKPEAADEDGFRAFLDRINSMDAQGELRLQFDPDFRIYLAKTANPAALVTLAGAVDKDEFAAILKYIDTPADQGSSPLDAPGAKATVACLGAAQLSHALVNPDEVYLVYALQEADRIGRTLPSNMPDEAKEAVARVVDSRKEIVTRLAGKAKAKDADAAFGIGAEDGYITLRFAMPAATVTAVIRRHELHQKMQQEATRAILDPRQTPPDGEEAEPEESEESEEAVEAAAAGNGSERQLFFR